MSKLDLTGLRKVVENIRAYTVPASRRINDKPLSADVTLNAGDVGAVPASGFDAAAVPFIPPTGMAASNVQDAIAEVYNKAPEGDAYVLTTLPVSAWAQDLSSGRDFQDLMIMEIDATVQDKFYVDVFSSDWDIMHQYKLAALIAEYMQPTMVRFWLDEGGELPTSDIPIKITLHKSQQEASA